MHCQELIRIDSELSYRASKLPEHKPKQVTFDKPEILQAKLKSAEKANA